MKKILVLMIAFCAIALLPQNAMAQEQTKPATKATIQKKGEVVAPVKKENVDAAKKMKKNSTKRTYTKTNVNGQASPEVKQKGKTTTTPAKGKGRYKAVITPLKNRKNNNVTVGKKTEKKKKDIKPSNEKVNIPIKE